MSIKILHGDCLGMLPTLAADSVDACVTDPPYFLGFMGREWDTVGKVRKDTAPERDAAYRHDGKGAQPFGYSHGSGAKPSEGPEMQRRHQEWATEVLRVLKPGAHLLAFGGTRTYHRLTCAIEDAGFEIRDCLMWLHGQGFPKGKSQLKPAWEPIILARKPGKGAGLGIDGCRLAIAESDDIHAKNPHTFGTIGAKGIYGAGEPTTYVVPAGRWPANVVLDEDAAALLDEQSGERKGGRGGVRIRAASTDLGVMNDDTWTPKPIAQPSYADSGGASRFFYTAKASPSERGAYNDHPTVKPLALMRWLVRIVTPSGGVVLDPFLGSGTTALACQREGFACIGIERDEHSVEIARRRLSEDAGMFADVTVAS